MAKDPAFLFYPNDWLGGTMALSRHHKGCYIDLLVAQFNNGPLSLDTIKAVLGQDQAVWTVLSKKFKQTAEGLWFNERLELEKQKRGQFIDKQKINGSKGGRKPKHNPSLKPNATNKEDGNEIEDEVGIKNETLIIPSMISTWKQFYPKAMIRLEDDSVQLFEIAKKMKDWLSLNGDIVLESNAEIIKSKWKEMVEFSSKDNFLQRYSLVQMNTHLPSVIQAFNSKNNGTHKQTSGKSTGAEQLLSDLKETFGAGAGSYQG